jgi:hypothetical protein
MIKKLCVTGLLVAATAGTTLLVATPAQADSWNGNSSRNWGSSQSGNNFGTVVTSNVGGHGATNVNNVNGNAVTTTNGSGSRLGVDLD